MQSFRQRGRRAGINRVCSGFSHGACFSLLGWDGGGGDVAFLVLRGRVAP